MIHLSQSAIQEVLRLRTKHSTTQALLRIGLQPSCCDSLAYHLEFAPEPTPHDRIYALEKLQVAIASQDVPYLDGLTLDYTEDLMGGGFRFHNPNATQTCDCGNAFAIAEVAPDVPTPNQTI